MWQVVLTGKTRKQVKDLPLGVAERLKALLLEIQACGPVRDKWPNYGKIRGSKDCHHCHIKKGHPTYVVVWQVTDQAVRLVEVKYVGTHEGADYGRIC